MNRPIIMIKILLLFWVFLLPSPAWSSLDPALDDIGMLVRLRDYRQAVVLLKPLVKKGNREAQYRLAGLYRSGKGVQRNLKKATELYREAASANHPDAQYALGLLLEKTIDSPASRHEVRQWYRKSAAQGHSLAKVKFEAFEDFPLPIGKALGRAGIFDAIRHNDEMFITALIADGANLKVRDNQGNTPFMAALRAEWPQLALRLLKNSRQFNQPNQLGNRPLVVASARGYMEIVVALLKRRIDIDQTDRRGDTALMLAVRNQHVAIARLLLERGASHKRVNKKNNSAVDLAYVAGNSSSKALFAKLGLKPIVRSKKPVISDLKAFKKLVRLKGKRYTGWPLLNIAIESSDRSIVNQLLAQKPDLATTDLDGNTALHVAARMGDIETLRLLFTKKIDVNATNIRDETALYLAVDSESSKSVDFLLKKKADPSIETTFGSTPFELAIEKKQNKSARSLLKSKHIGANRHRFVLKAIQAGMDDLSSELIKQDKAIAVQDTMGRTVLWHSAAQGLVKTSDKLIKTGKFNINQTDVNGHSALARAIINGHEKTVNLLLNSKADFNVITNEGNSLLMLAVLSEKPRIVKDLLLKKVNVNVKDDVGDTALMLAAGTGQEIVVKMLIISGADKQLRNNEELNAYQIAKNSGHKEIVNLIHDSSNIVFKLFN